MSKNPFQRSEPHDISNMKTIMPKNVMRLTFKTGKSLQCPIATERQYLYRSRAQTLSKKAPTFDLRLEPRPDFSSLRKFSRIFPGKFCKIRLRILLKFGPKMEPHFYQKEPCPQKKARIFPFLDPFLDPNLGTKKDPKQHFQLTQKPYFYQKQSCPKNCELTPKPVLTYPKTPFEPKVAPKESPKKSQTPEMPSILGIKPKIP